MRSVDVFREKNIIIEIRPSIGPDRWCWVCEADEVEDPFAMGYEPTRIDAVSKASEAAKAYLQSTVVKIEAWAAAMERGGK